MSGVFVYKNLHKDCWSVRSNKTRLVIAHRYNLVLKNCVLRVSEISRQRVIREKRKNVHAGISGFVTTKGDGNWVRIGYNPYKSGYFYVITTGEPVYSAKFVRFVGSEVYAVLE